MAGVAVQETVARVTSFSTKDVERSAQWRHALDNEAEERVPIARYLPPEKDPADGYRVEYLFSRIGSLNLLQGIVDPQGRRRARRFPEETPAIAVAVALSGTMHVDGDRQDRPVHVGDIYLFDWAVPFHMVNRSTIWHAYFDLPRTRLSPEAERRTQHGRIFAANGALTSLLRRHLHRLMVLENGDAPSYPELPDDVQALALALVEGTRDALAEVQPRLVRAQRAAVRDVIRARAPFSDVPTEQLAARFGMSPAYLEGIFALEGSSVRQEVLACRLELCQRALSDPRFLGRSHVEIAASFGFDDWMAFVRAYRGRFGVAPGRVVPRG